MVIYRLSATALLCVFLQVSTASTHTGYYPTVPKQNGYDDSYTPPIKLLSESNSNHNGDLPPGYLCKPQHNYRSINLPPYGTLETYGKLDTPTKSTYQSYSTPKKEDRTGNTESLPLTPNLYRRAADCIPIQQCKAIREINVGKPSTQVLEEVIGYTPSGDKNGLSYPDFFQTADWGNGGSEQYPKPGTPSLEEIVGYASIPSGYYDGSSAHEKPQSYPQPPIKPYSSGSDRSDHNKPVHIYSPIPMMYQKPREKTSKYGYSAAPYHDSPYQCPSSYSWQPNYEHSCKPNYGQSNKPNYGQSYKTNYEHFFKPNYGQSYKPNYEQSYKPNYGQSYKPSYEQSYKTNYEQSYKPNYEQLYKPNYEQGYKLKCQHQRSPGQKKGSDDDEPYSASSSKYYFDAGGYASGIDYQKGYEPSYQQDYQQYHQTTDSHPLSTYPSYRGPTKRGYEAQDYQYDN